MRGRTKERTSAHSNTNTHRLMIDQTEKLALCPVSRSFAEDAALDPVFADDSPPVADTLLTNEQWRYITTVSTPSNGFRMPSIQAVRLNDARLSARMGARSEECGEEETGSVFYDDEEQLPPETWAPYVLPSARNRGAIRVELRGMGFTWGE